MIDNRPAAPGAGPGRIVSIDAVRGLAILLMVFSHGLNWFHVDGSHAVLSIGRMSLGDGATPLFFVIAGVALSLSLRARLRPGANRRHLLHQYLRRFRQLFVLGIPISFAWGVLQAQAVVLSGLAVLALRSFAAGRRWSGWPFLMAAAALVLHRVALSMDAVPRLIGGLFRGQFPLFAITALISFGFGWGRLLSRPAWPRLYCAGGALFAGLALVTARSSTEGGVVLAPLSRPDMPFSYVFFGVAATLWLVALGHRARRLAPITGTLAKIGRYGLFLYMSHYILILVQVAVFGWWRALDTPEAVAASLLLVVTTVTFGLHYQIDTRRIYEAMDNWVQRGADWTAARGYPASGLVQGGPVHASFGEARIAWFDGQALGHRWDVNSVDGLHGPWQPRS